MKNIDSKFPFQNKKKGTSNEELASQLAQKATDIGTLSKGTPTNGLWGDIEQRGININWHGADKTGVADSYSSFTNALSGVSDHKRLDIPSGTYKLGNMVTISNLKQLTIKGEHSKLKANTNNTILKIMDVEELHIEGIDFDKNNTEGFCLELYRVKRIVISKCIFRNVNKSTSGGTVSALRIGTGCEDVIIDNNFISDVSSLGASAGILVDNFDNVASYSSNIIISNNIIKNISTNNDADGIKIQQGNTNKVNVIIDNNVFVDCAKRSVKVQSERVIITNNLTIATLITSSFAVFAAMANDVTINNNKSYNINSFWYSAVEIHAFKNISMKNNHFVNSTSMTGQACFMIRLEKGLGTTHENIEIDGNTFENMKSAIYMPSGNSVKHLSISGNKFLGLIQLHVIEMAGNVDIATIKDNKFAPTANYFLRFYGVSNTVTNTIVADNIGKATQGIIDIAATADRIIKDNINVA